MRVFRGVVVWVVIVLVLLLVGGKLFLRSARGVEWVSGRLASALSMDATVREADLRFPADLWLSGVELTGRGTGVDDALEALRAHEMRLGWRGGRCLIDLRRPEVTLAFRDGRWEPPAWSPLARVEQGLPEALERISLLFRADWDWTIRDGRVWALLEDGQRRMLARGLHWDGLRLRLPERDAWYQAVDIYDWQGGPTNAIESVRFEWLSLSSEEGVARLHWSPLTTEPN